VAKAARPKKTMAIRTENKRDIGAISYCGTHNVKPLAHFDSAQDAFVSPSHASK
jgi:hypothetical protein